MSIGIRWAVVLDKRMLENIVKLSGDLDSSETGGNVQFSSRFGGVWVVVEILQLDVLHQFLSQFYDL